MVELMKFGKSVEGGVGKHVGAVSPLGRWIVDCFRDRLVYVTLKRRGSPKGISRDLILGTLVYCLLLLSWYSSSEEFYWELTNIYLS